MPDTTLIRLAFLWGQGEVHGRQLDRRARTYEPLEQHRRIVWIAGGIVVGARTDVLVTTPVDAAGRRRDVVLFWTLVEPDRLAVERADGRSEEHTSELQSLMRISYAVFCLKKKQNKII